MSASADPMRIKDRRDLARHLQAQMAAARTAWPPAAGGEDEIAAVARHVLTELVAALVSGIGTITSDGILQQTHKAVYEVMRPTGAKSELGQIRDRVTEVLKTAAANEFAEWLERVAHDPEWRFKRALGHEPKERTRDLKALQRAANAMLTRQGAPVAELPLFEDDES